MSPGFVSFKLLFIFWFFVRNTMTAAIEPAVAKSIKVNRTEFIGGFINGVFWLEWSFERFLAE